MLAHAGECMQSILPCTSMSKLIGTKELAKRLGVSLRKLEQMIARGELPSHAKLGRTRKWREDEIENWLDSLFGKKHQ